MPKLSVEELKEGMVLSRPILNESGIVLIAANTALTTATIDKVKQMNVHSVSIAGAGKSQAERDELLRELDRRFTNAHEDPYLALLKEALREHIEGL